MQNTSSTISPSMSKKKKTLLWVLRICAAVLFLASIYIIYSTISQNKPNDFWLKYRTTPQFNFYEQPGQFLNRANQKITLNQLPKKPALITFVYKDCMTVCPRIMQDVFRLRDKLKDSKDKMNFVIIFFDDIKGKVKAIEDYYGKYKLLDDTWHVLATDPQNLRALADKFKLRYEVINEEKFDYMHSNMISITDKDGKMLLADYGLNEEVQDKIAAIMKKL